MPDQPNILVFLTDDHAQWALGCYGNREVHTPTLDYLAKTGVRMENAFTPIPVCSPARACFFTGLYPSQHGIHDWLFYFRDRADLPDIASINDRQWINDPTLAQLLQDAGYETALVGKWHCGQDEIPQPGFDHWYSLRSNFPPKGGKYSDNGTLVEETGYHTDIITDHAIDFLRQHDSARPFFLFAGHIATHSPWRGHPERLVEQYRGSDFADITRGPVYSHARLRDESTDRHRRDEERAQYYASASHIDEGVGRVIDELEALGLRENTLVVYVSDHGLMCGQHGIWGKGNGTRPLNMLEESIRIPMIFNFPGQLMQGQERSEFVDHCDLFETLLDFAGVEYSGDRSRPGRSFKEMLTDARPPLDWKRAQFGEYGDLRMIRTQRHKLVRRYPDGPQELYDLLNDPGETRSDYDLPEAQSIVAQLDAQLDDFFARYEDPRVSGLKVRELPQHNHVEAWRDVPY